MWSLNQPSEKDMRRFGEFRCKECNRSWMSANAWENMGQKCETCNVWVYPHKLSPLEKGHTKHPEKSHPQELCQKCKQLGTFCGRRY